jgi:hypothetical protein
MRYLILTIYLLTSLFYSYSQSDSVVFNTGYDDIAYDMIYNPDSALILLGSSRTNPQSYGFITITSYNNASYGSKVIASSSTDIPGRIILTNDSTYAVAASGWKQGLWMHNCRLFKLNKDFEIEWDVSIGSSFRDDGFSVIQTMDNSFVVSGSTNENTWYSNALISKVSATGDIIWSKKIETSTTDYAFDIIENSNEELIVVGNQSGFINMATSDIPVNNSDIFIKKLDNQGNILWSKSIGGDRHDFVSKIKAAPDGGYYLFGSTQNNSNGSFDMYLVKIDDDGNIEWEQNYGKEGYDIGNSIAIDESNNLYLFGTSEVVSPYNTDLLLVKTNSLGEMIWEESYGGGESFEKAAGIVTKENGESTLLASLKNCITCESSLMLLKVDDLGNIEQINNRLDSNIKVNVYPNPCSNDILFNLINFGDYKEFDVEVYNDIGKRVFQKKVISNTIHLDTKNFPSGIYYYNIYSKNSLYPISGKFIVHH